MGVERAVTCWYIQRHILLSEIALLEAQLKCVEPATVPMSDTVDISSAELLQQFAKAQAKLSSLGPCPKPMMG